jgi:hypothetical protein
MLRERSRPGGDADLGSKLTVDGAEIIASPKSFPESVLERIRGIADSHPEVEVETAWRFD